MTPSHPPRSNFGPMILAFVLASCAAMTPTRAIAQGTEDDPLMGEKVLGNAAEIVILHSGFQFSDVNVDTLDFLSLPGSVIPDVTGELTEESQMTESGATASTFESRTGTTQDIWAGDLTGDPVDDVVAVWPGPDDSINAIFPTVNSGTLGWTQSNPIALEPANSMLSVQPGSNSGRRSLRIIGAMFDEDAQSELVLAYIAQDQSLVLTVFDTNGTLVPAFVTQIADEDLTPFAGSSSSSNNTRSIRFDIAAGDVDGDGFDELVVATAGPTNSACAGPADPDDCFQVLVKVYDYDQATDTLVAGAREILFSSTQRNTVFITRLVVATGDFTGNAIDEVAVGYLQSATNNGIVRPWWLQPVSFASDLQSASVGPQFVVESSTSNDGYPLGIVASDMDMNGTEELIWQGRNLHGLAIDDTLMVGRVRGPTSHAAAVASNAHRGLAVVDLDADQDVGNDVGDWRKEIVIGYSKEVADAMGLDNVLEIVVFDWGNTDFEERARIETQLVEPSATRPFSLVGADLGGNGIKVVGTPTVSRVTEIAQPLVVLNAPPTHFDVFFDGMFDVSECYGENLGVCDFITEYTATNSGTMEVSTEVRTDWGSTLRASGGLTIPIIDVGVKASLAATHGESFRKYENIGQSFRFTETRTAIRDDRILASVTDLDIFEYPVFMNGQLEAYISVVRPVAPRLQFFPSKSFTATTYIPTHEVGNILSYPTLGGSNFDPALNPALGDTVDFASTATTLDETCCGTFTIEFGSFSEDLQEREIFNAISGSVDFDIPISFIPNVGVDGNYSDTEISMHRSTVGMDISVEVTLGSIDTAIGGGTGYTVREYAYWSTYGALVVDYAVQPELAQPPFETFWQERYGQTVDPAFLLPFRLDVEKGLAGNSTMAQETRDIIFAPASPEPGSTVDMTARIWNYSLLPTAGPVEVRFFLGDPVGNFTRPICGAIPNLPCIIQGTGGETDVVTVDSDDFATSIQPQSHAFAKLQWVVPTTASGNTSSSLRVYGVIDPDDQLGEVHEENNVGAVFVTMVPEPSAGALDLVCVTTLIAFAALRRKSVTSQPSGPQNG
jgi:hypothetical protein